MLTKIKNSRSSSNSKTTQVEQRRQDVGDKSFTWKSFDGVVGDTEIRLERLKCNDLSSEPISVIPTFFLM